MRKKARLCTRHRAPLVDVPHVSRRYFSRFTSQCSGMSPSQWTPRFEADVGVEAAGDGAVDDGLLLLLQQLDQLLLGADERRIRRSTWSRNRTMAACSSSGGTGAE